jgi:hypothetical protein
MQQFASRIASKTSDGSALRKQIGLNAPGLEPTTTAGPNMKTPAPLGEAKIGLTDDDPRKKQALLRRAGQPETILGTKLG